MITQERKVDFIQVLLNGIIQVRTATYIYDDGEQKAVIDVHRHILEPGSDLAEQDARVVSIAQASWTPAVIEAYETAKAAQIELMTQQTIEE